MKGIRGLIIAGVILIVGLIAIQYVRDATVNAVESSQEDSNAAELEKMKASYVGNVRAQLIKEYEVLSRPENSTTLDSYLECVWEGFKSEVLPYVKANKQPPKGAGSAAGKDIKRKCSHIVSHLTK